MDKKRKATIFDFKRMCNNNECGDCPFYDSDYDYVPCRINIFLSDNTEKANEIILKWIDEHPIKTRKMKFFEMFPNAKIVDISPCSLDKNLYDVNEDCVCKRSIEFGGCIGCERAYWNEDINEE